MELVLLIGIQGAGKSTFFARRFADTHVRVNLDMLRTRHRERLLFQACVEGKTRVVVDNTNVSRVEREKYVVPAREAGFAVRGFFFSPVLDECAERNAARKDPIPGAALRNTLARLEVPAFEEGFDDLYSVRLAGGEFIVTEVPRALR